MKFIKATVMLLLLLLLVSCSETVKVNLSASELAESASDALPLSAGYYKPSEAYFEYYFSDPNDNIDILSLVSDWSIMKSGSQSSENEIGVLIANDGCIETVQEACLEYLDERKEAYLEAKASYSPGEYEKYRDAECFVAGNCVYYLILDSGDRDIAKRAIDMAIEK